jgi:hypothetical protein
MTDDEELLAIIARDGPSGGTRDRKLLGAILTSTDYMVAGMFIPTDPEQAEHALVTGGEIVLWRTRPLAPEDEIRMRDTLHALSRQKGQIGHDVRFWRGVSAAGGLAYGRCARCGRGRLTRTHPTSTSASKDFSIHDPPRL